MLRPVDITVHLISYRSGKVHQDQGLSQNIAASIINVHNLVLISSHQKPKQWLLVICSSGWNSYFKKHLSALISSFSLETPVQLYNSIESSSTKPTERHKLWLQKIRNTVSNRIVNEEERVPTYTALWRHWLPSCWVSKMWKNSPVPDNLYNLPRTEDSGWIRTSDQKFSVDWEAPEVQKKITATIEFLTKGCMELQERLQIKERWMPIKRHTVALRVNAMDAATYL